MLPGFRDSPPANRGEGVCPSEALGRWEGSQSTNQLTLTAKRWGFPQLCRPSSTARAAVRPCQTPQRRRGSHSHRPPAQGTARGRGQPETGPSPALTLPSVAARGPAQGQGGGGARRGDSGQEGAGVQRRAAPAGPGQHVPVQPHGPLQRPPQPRQQLQRRSHGARACHLFIAGLRRVLTKEATAVSNTAVSSDPKPQML